MERRSFIKKGLSGLMAAHLLPMIPKIPIFPFRRHEMPQFKRDHFGPGFSWGVATSAFQTEGAFEADGKGLSIWDAFTRKKNAVKGGQKADIAVDFYHRYPEDIGLIKEMGLDAFRFSLSWPRIIPEGTGRVNAKGADYYHRVIDTCLEHGIEPWITLYHWDLPQVLEEKGGWTSREIIHWFGEYVDVCTRLYGDKVKNWIILNEPMSFTGLGYYSGYHAPGRKGIASFLPAVHHAALCQAEGGRITRANCPGSTIGSTFSFSHIEPAGSSEKHLRAAARVDALLNRLFIEPALGLGYPFSEVNGLRWIERYIKPGDVERLAFDFDFHGIQYYFRLVTAFSLYPPVLFAREIPAPKRNVPVNSMGLEVYPNGLAKVIDRVGRYQGVKNMVVTECGVCFHDVLDQGMVHDWERWEYLKDCINITGAAVDKGMPVKGFFAWTLTDNFEWSEGFDARFGLVYVDIETQQRVMKDSALALKRFLCY